MKYFFVPYCIFNSFFINAQGIYTLEEEKFSIHSQVTIVNQYKPAFKAIYSGDNSLLTNEENKTSITSTLFLGAKLWKGGSVFINGEIAGGSGLSSTLGIADATNGETFRVGSPEPKIYLARFFYKQVFSLGKERIYQSGSANQLAEYLPHTYFSFVIGKMSVADFFDRNKYSHDPRKQFMNWGLMSNGAWDYPADVRGYTPSIVFELVSVKHELRYGVSLTPLIANGADINWDISKASSHTMEYTHNYTLKNRNGAIRLLLFFTTAGMGNYNQSIFRDNINPLIENTRQYGNTKYGFGINAEQDLSEDIGFFLKGSWNDGNNETWAFTEIDQSISMGIAMAGKRWKREDDNVGLAYVTSGISIPHRNYLQAGGKGFILGDGNLNYGREHLIEFYYSAALLKNNIRLTFGYQYLLNPGYNTDRSGPVHVFSVRFHSEL